MPTNEHMQYRNSRAIASKNAAATFARLIYTGYPNMTLDELYAMVISFRLTKTFDAVAYRSSFIDTYKLLRLKSGHMLPLSVQETEEELATMGKLANVQVKQMEYEQLPFVKARQLVEVDAFFCIKKIHLATTQFGPTWFITIQLDDVSCESLDCSEHGYATLTMENRGNKRDDLLHELKSITPIHGVEIQQFMLENGNTFFNFREAVEETSCPCKVRTDAELIADDVDDASDDNAPVVKKATNPAKVASPTKPSAPTRGTAGRSTNTVKQHNGRRAVDPLGNLDDHPF